MESAAKKIARLRNELGWSKAALARVSGVPRQTILRIEDGSSEDPHDSTISILANAMESALRRQNAAEGDAALEAEKVTSEFMKSRGIGALHLVIDWFRTLNSEERSTAANVIDAYAGRVHEEAAKAVRKAGRQT